MRKFILIISISTCILGLTNIPRIAFTSEFYMFEKCRKDKSFRFIMNRQGNMSMFTREHGAWLFVNKNRLYIKKECLQ